MSNSKNSSKDPDSTKKGPNEDDGSDSLWSHLKYGLGTAAFMIGPALIPGATSRHLVMGYGAFLVIVLCGICVWGIVRSLGSSRGRR